MRVWAACSLWIACGAPAATHPAGPRVTARALDEVFPGAVGTGDVGTDGPMLVLGAAADRRWVAMCQAQHDDDGDGTVAVEEGRDHYFSGDELREYLVIGGGAGSELAGIEAIGDARLVAWAAGVDGLWLIDPDAGTATELPGAQRARAWKDGAAAISSSGAEVAYLVDGGVAVLDVATGATSRTPAADAVAIAAVDDAGRWVQLVSGEATSGANVWDTPCRSIGLVLHRPATTDRWLDTRTGTSGDPPAPVPRAIRRARVGGELAPGPLRWSAP
jgi:hypothetical protein